MSLLLLRAHTFRLLIINRRLGRPTVSSINSCCERYLSSPKSINNNWMLFCWYGFIAAGLEARGAREEGQHRSHTSDKQDALRNGEMPIVYPWMTRFACATRTLL